MLCLFMVLCNCSVTQIVYRSYRNMHQLTMSCLKSDDNLIRDQQPIKLRHQISVVSSCSATSKSISMITRDEIKFINMCNLLTASFVLCWGTQMVNETSKGSSRKQFTLIRRKRKSFFFNRRRA